MKGVLLKYFEALKKVQVHGPTYLSHVLNEVNNDCEFDVKLEHRSNLKYNILLIICDGVINDVTESID